ncbi:PREDICTED: elicitor peptide 5-like [Camelina sativa]|uniref:Elicitor peptide 5-like n=1 Tax=Camelina sativa TaxID=90675 RepID=A0ABM1QT00_CAMSA|nr:PREDICTED: elicitor peptide 5-like [Camelina sativa]XP_019089889.1 PREDICTED: elicitor peptide 5-like [Camelina sativa]
MQREKDNKKDCCKVIPQPVKDFIRCLRFRRSSSSSSDMAKTKPRKNEEKLEDSSIETTTRGIKLMGRRIRKQPVSSGKRGGVNNYDM